VPGEIVTTEGNDRFEVDTVTAVKLADKMAEVGAALHRLGCPLVLDDSR